MNKLLIKLLNRKLFILIVVWSFLMCGVASTQTSAYENADCPQVISSSNLSLPFSLFYTKNYVITKLWEYHAGVSQLKDFEIIPSYVLRISPDGRKLLYFSTQNQNNTATGSGNDLSSIIVYDLPIPANDANKKSQAFEYHDEWPAFKGGAGWLDNTSVYMNAVGNQIVVLNVNDSSSYQIAWSKPSDLWNDLVWGTIYLSHDLTYFVYPSSTISDGSPNSRTGETMLNLSTVNDPSVRQKLLTAYLGTLRWQDGSHSFIVQGTDYIWYEIDAEKATETISPVYKGQGLSIFHDQSGAVLGVPSVSPNGEKLTALAYLPNEKRSTLVMLSRGINNDIDMCLHGDYLPQIINSDQVSSVWSPDSKYAAFSLVSNGVKGLYIYDVEQNTIALVDKLEDGNLVEIVGWGT